MSQKPNKIEFKMLDYERLENEFVSFKLEDGTIVKVKVDLDRVGIATNFKINGKDYIIPMVIEEPSVIAAASKGAKIARIKGGFEVTANESYSIGQIQLLDVDIPSAIQKINNSSNEILKLANSKSNTLSKMNKGAKEISCKEINTPSCKMLIVELLIDVGDAMGANITNTMCEAVSPLIEKITGGRTLLRILSNYSTR